MTGLKLAGCEVFGLVWRTGGRVQAAFALTRFSTFVSNNSLPSLVWNYSKRY